MINQSMTGKSIISKSMKSLLAAVAVGALLGSAGAGALANGATAAETVAAVQTAKVNINTADAETLARMLNGIGQARAEEIVRYRETYGTFTTVEELAEVKGIGAATVERNRAVIVLE
jgi:competence protein ComEA